jgi:hypothetical protein
MTDEKTPRPTRNDDNVIRAAALKLAEDCAEWDSETPTAEWVDALLKCKRHWSDGYELARELQDRCWVSPDAALVEVLDGASSYLWSAENEAVKAWIAEHGVTAPLSIGTRVACGRGTGEITRIDAERGAYVVLPDAERGDPKFSRGGGWIINYDDATETAEAA